MRELTVKDLPLLSAVNMTWPLKEYLSFWEIEGAGGWIDGQAFILGLEIRGAFFIEKMSVAKPRREEFFDELRFKYDTLIFETEFDNKNAGLIFAFVDLGFEAEANGMMKIKLSLRRTL